MVFNRRHSTTMSNGDSHGKARTLCASGVLSEAKEDDPLEGAGESNPLPCSKASLQLPRVRKGSRLAT